VVRDRGAASVRRAPLVALCPVLRAPAVAEVGLRDVLLGESGGLQDSAVEGSPEAQRWRVLVGQRLVDPRPVVRGTASDQIERALAHHAELALVIRLRRDVAKNAGILWPLAGLLRQEIVQAVNARRVSHCPPPPSATSQAPARAPRRRPG